MINLGQLIQLKGEGSIKIFNLNILIQNIKDKKSEENNKVVNTSSA